MEEHILHDKIFQLKFAIIILSILAIISFILCLMLSFSKELVGAICTGVLFIILLILIIVYSKMKRKLEIALQEFRNNLRKW